MNLESQYHRHFLIVENDPNDAYLLRRAFTKVEVEATCYVCRHPTEAKAYLRGAGMYADRVRFPVPSAIISDMKMGTETGLEFLAWVQEESETPDIPLVILSGSGSREELDGARNLGIWAVYQKPHRFEELVEMMTELLLQFGPPKAPEEYQVKMVT